MGKAEGFMDKVRAGKVPNVGVDTENPATAYTSMDLNTPRGIKVRFTGYGGYDHDKEKARKYLQVDTYYTVKEISVGDWSSTVEFKEVPDEHFNTVMFEASLYGER